MESHQPIGGWQMSGEVRAAQAGADGPEVVLRHLLADVARAPGQRVQQVDACHGCGADVEKKAFALSCRSCGEFLVRDSDLTERARPDLLLPFAIDEQTARAAFTTWVSSRRFAPQSLKGVRQVRTIDGAFLPFWSFDVATTSTYRGERGDTRHHQVMRSRTDPEGRTENYWETESYTDWTPVAGRVDNRFRDMLIPACSPLAQRIPDWPLQQAAPYRRGASYGKRVIGYDIEPETGFDTAADLMRRTIDREVRSDIGGDNQQVHDVDTTYIDPSYSLLLLPAWLVSYTHEKRTWSALVNGSTGEVVGDRPYSPAKISVLAAVVALAVVVGVLAMTHHLG
jgi:hypothetical protein